MRCVYCQNFRFSQLGEGFTASGKTLEKIFLAQRDRGTHNINLVTPTHYLPDILDALCGTAEELGPLPIVYNTSGYESPEILELLNGVVDIYLADMRYGDNELAAKYSRAGDYVQINRKAIAIMKEQVGQLRMGEDGAAKRGLIIRHLVLPNHIKNTETVLEHIADHVSKDTHISLMSQYLPLHNAGNYPELGRALNEDEYKAACELLQKFGLHNGWTQEPSTK